MRQSPESRYRRQGQRSRRPLPPARFPPEAGQPDHLWNRPASGAVVRDHAPGHAERFGCARKRQAIALHPVVELAGRRQAGLPAGQFIESVGPQTQPVRPIQPVPPLIAVMRAKKPGVRSAPKGGWARSDRSIAKVSPVLQPISSFRSPVTRAVSMRGASSWIEPPMCGRPSPGLRIHEAPPTLRQATHVSLAPACELLTLFPLARGLPQRVRLIRPCPAPAP